MSSVTLARCNLPWADDGPWSDAVLPGISAHVLGYPGEATFDWAVEGEFGEAPTLDAAKAAAERAARPIIERLITQRESEIAELRRALG